MSQFQKFERQFDKTDNPPARNAQRLDISLAHVYYLLYTQIKMTMDEDAVQSALQCPGSVKLRPGNLPRYSYKRSCCVFLASRQAEGWKGGLRGPSCLCSQEGKSGRECREESDDASSDANPDIRNAFASHMFLRAGLMFCEHRA